MAKTDSIYIFSVEDGIIYRTLKNQKNAEKEELTHQRQLSDSAMLKYFQFKNPDKKAKDIVALFLQMKKTVVDKQEEYKPKKKKEYVLKDGKRIPKFNADGTQKFDKKGNPVLEYKMVDSPELRKEKTATAFEIGNYFWTEIYGKELVPPQKRKNIKKAQTEEEKLLKLLES